VREIGDAWTAIGAGKGLRQVRRIAFLTEFEYASWTRVPEVQD
jgi:hypothetical protein